MEEWGFHSFIWLIFSGGRCVELAFLDALNLASSHDYDIEGEACYSANAL
jgi:hypothetical protein